MREKTEDKNFYEKKPWMFKKKICDNTKKGFKGNVYTKTTTNNKRMRKVLR
jgi:hypothetical protein